MIISAKKILELNKEHNIIQNLAERELHPEGAGFDIRVEEVFKLEGSGFLGVEERDTPDAKKAADIKDGDSDYTLNPGEYVLVKTVEQINLPGSKIEVSGKKMFLSAHVYPRSTLQRSGVMLKTTKTDPGYSGELTFGMFNAGPCPFRFELGSRIANIVFMEVHGDLAREYAGQWKGGRVSTEGKETQN